MSLLHFPRKSHYHYDDMGDAELIRVAKDWGSSLTDALAERLAMRNRDIVELAREKAGLYKPYLILDGDNHD
jgi:hypothetical protein